MTDLDVSSLSFIMWCSQVSSVAQGRKPMQYQHGSPALGVPGVFDGGESE